MCRQVGKILGTAASVLALWLSATGCEESHARAAGPLQVASPAFDSGGDIPREHTCDGADMSPRLTWAGVPEDSRSLVLLVTDPDAPGGTFTHWVAYDIPPNERSLETGQPREPQLPNGGTQGRNDFGSVGWRGPCPPHGSEHRYLFRLHALDTMLSAPPGATREDIEQAMEGHITAAGELIGRYARDERGAEPKPP